MRTKILLGVMMAGLGLGGVALFSSVAQAQAKNLKVLPKDITKDELKALMKNNIAKALGVTCDHCHDIDDMSKDTEKKEIARAMMKMTSEINTKNFKGKNRVTCLTCHNGDIKPKE
jgi:hypothetical protein